MGHAVRPRGSPQPAREGTWKETPAAREACGKENRRAAGQPAGTPERKQPMFGPELLGIFGYLAGILAGALMLRRVLKRHGRIGALLYGAALLLVFAACSPASFKNFLLRALLRLL